jgi:hypothetical protein
MQPDKQSFWDYLGITFESPEDKMLFKLHFTMRKKGYLQMYYPFLSMKYEEDKEIFKKIFYKAKAKISNSPIKEFLENGK